ncbi:MAG: hypothetical protein AUI14_06370 [Actinobacteria bacterium 13_2_20CM_2_71_6]|nr:MAG: hypothetical protein AUI14_06370 [Actinobacteria bacterium 13_2_20CM_2_71_6]
MLVPVVTSQNRTVWSGGSGNQHGVGDELGGVDAVGVSGQRAQELAGGQVPQPKRSVPVADCGQPTVRADGHSSAGPPLNTLSGTCRVGSQSTVVPPRLVEITLRSCGATATGMTSPVWPAAGANPTLNP